MPAKYRKIDFEEAIKFPVPAFSGYAPFRPPLVLQCRSRKRSLRAYQFLSENSFENLYNLEGGILAWIESEYEIERL